MFLKKLTQFKTLFEVDASRLYIGALVYFQISHLWKWTFNFQIKFKDKWGNYPQKINEWIQSNSWLDTDV